MLLMLLEKEYDKIQSQKNTQNTFSTNGYYEATKFILRGSEITPTLYVLTLEGCDIVLGVDCKVFLALFCGTL